MKIKRKNDFLSMEKDFKKSANESVGKERQIK